MSCFKTVNRTVVQCSCGSAVVVEHYVSSTKVVGLIPREHILTIQIKVSAKCINVNVGCSIPELQSFQLFPVFPQKDFFSIFVTCLFFIKNKSKAQLIYHH